MCSSHSHFSKWVNPFRFIYFTFTAIFGMWIETWIFFINVIYAEPQIAAAPDILHHSVSWINLQGSLFKLFVSLHLLSSATLKIADYILHVRRNSLCSLTIVSQVCFCIQQNILVRLTVIISIIVIHNCKDGTFIILLKR